MWNHHARWVALSKKIIYLREWSLSRMKTGFKWVVFSRALRVSVPLCPTQMHIFVCFYRRFATGSEFCSNTYCKQMSHCQIGPPLLSHTDVLSLQTPPFAMTAGLLLPVLVPVQSRPICADTCPSLAQSWHKPVSIDGYSLQDISQALFLLVTVICIPLCLSV